jgi:hypothetical protein
MRNLFEIEKGLSITGVNVPSGVKVLFGAAVPGGDTADQDAAEVGSIYLQTTGVVWVKKTNSSSPADWKQLGDVSVLKWRQEIMRAATSQAAPSNGSSINLTTNPFSDDDAPLLDASSFQVGDYVLFGIGGTPKIMQVSAISAPNVTFVDILDNLEESDLMFVKAYLPDTPDDQEKQAIVSYTGGAIQKIADVNWNFADGINLQGSIVDRNGPVAGGDTVQVAIEKLEGDCKDTATLSGVSRGAVNLGTFTGKTITANQTTKSALQQVVTALEARSQLTGVVSTPQTLDAVNVDVIKMAKWIVHAFEEAAPSSIKTLEITAVHNGTAAADATATDNTVSHKLSLGGNFNFVVDVDLNGAGAAQEMRLRVSSTSAGLTVTARRLEVY